MTTHTMVIHGQETQVTIIFTQPFLVGKDLAERCTGKTVVLDIAFNAESPQGKGTPEEQYRQTTGAFIEGLGDRLVKWVDHHDHTHWADYKHDPRFSLVSRTEALACPPLLTPELCLGIGPIETIVAHGDFDGLMSAAKWLCNGWQPYMEADADSIAADSRQGTLSPTGQHFEAAMKANLADDGMRHAILIQLTGEYGSPEWQAAVKQVNEAGEKYHLIQENTERIALSFQREGHVAWVDARLEEQYDLTQLLLAGQKQAAVALVLNSQRGKNQITIAGPASYDFREMFGLTGGMPNRVNLPEQDPTPVIGKLNATFL